MRSLDDELLFSGDGVFIYGTGKREAGSTHLRATGSYRTTLHMDRRFREF